MHTCHSNHRREKVLRSQHPMFPNQPHNTNSLAPSEHPVGRRSSKVDSDDDSDEEPTKPETIRESVRKVIRKAINQTDGSPNHKLKIKSLFREVEKRRIGRRLSWTSKEANIRHLLSVHAEFMHDENHYWTLTEEGWRGKYRPRKESQDMSRKAKELRAQIAAREEVQRAIKTERMESSDTSWKGHHTDQNELHAFQNMPGPGTAMPEQALPNNHPPMNLEPCVQPDCPRRFNMNGASMSFEQYNHLSEFTHNNSQYTHFQGDEQPNSSTSAAQYPRPVPPQFHSYEAEPGIFSLQQAQQGSYTDQNPDPRMQLRVWQAVNSQSLLVNEHGFPEQQQNYRQRQVEDRLLRVDHFEGMDIGDMGLSFSQNLDDL